MKALSLLLESEGFDTSSLRELFVQERATTFALTLEGWDMLDDWVKLRDLVPKTRRWPVLLGKPGEEDLPTGRDFPKGTVASFLAEAEKIDGRALLDQWHDGQIKCIREDAVRHEAEGYEEDAEHFRELLKGPKEFRGIPRGVWPEDGKPTTRGDVAFRLTNQMDDDWNVHTCPVTLALLPTPYGWEAPAVLKFGGWNANPKPAQHVAVLRHWHGRYGAEVVAVTHDTVEMLVAKPPATRKAALRLARDQYHYCEDNIEQGSYSLEAEAAKLLRGVAWYFWWD